MKKKRLFLFSLIIIMMISVICLPTFAENDRPNLTDPNQWAGKKIGVITGGVYPELIQENYPGAQCVYFDSIADLPVAVMNNKVDAAVFDLPLAKYACAVNPGLSVEMAFDRTENIAIAAPKTERGNQLITEFNTWLAEYKKSGNLKKLTDKWVDHFSSSTEVGDYSNLPATKGTITVGTDATMVPFEFIKNVKFCGLDIELIRDFCKDNGYGLEFNNVSFSGLITGLGSGKYDLGASCIIETEERKESLLFSDSYCESGPAILYKNSEKPFTSLINSAKSSFIKTFVTENRWKLFVMGMLVTLEITCSSIIFGSLIGFILYTVCRNGNKITNAIANFCRWLIQGMPLVVFLMIMFYIILGQSQIGSIWVAIIAFTLIFACAVHTLLENGEKALDAGQLLAAKAMGYSDVQTLLMIILPQSAKHFLPVYLNDIDALLKSTAIVGYISVVDLSKAGDLVRGITYDPFFPLISVAIIYFILSAILKSIIRFFMRKMEPQRRSEEKILKGVQSIH